MKSIQELYNEVMADKGLKDALIGAAKAGRLEDFLKEHGCEATVEEVAAFLKAKAADDRPLSFDELESASGGECNRSTGVETAISVMTVGFGCAIKVIFSATRTVEETGYVGQEKDGDGRMCNKN